MTSTDQTSADVDHAPAVEDVVAIEIVDPESAAEVASTRAEGGDVGVAGTARGSEGSDIAAGIATPTAELADDFESADPPADTDSEAEDDADSEDENESKGVAEDESDGDNPLDVEAEVAADYLEELLDIADLDGDIDTYVDGDRAHVSIVSESDTLVGRNGEVLDALQELTRLAVVAETGQRSRLMLDVAGYRARRRGELVVLANDAAEEAKSSGEPVHLKPMNPFERKIVHDAVAAAGLTSESEGEEPRRHVVVLPARG